MTITLPRTDRSSPIEATVAPCAGMPMLSVPSVSSCLLRLVASTMEAIPLDGVLATDVAWANLHRCELTNLANRMLSGVSTARAEAAHPVWVDRAIASHEALMTQLGRVADGGSRHSRRITPTLIDGWHLVVSVHADDRSAVLVSGSYGPDGPLNPGYAVRWGARG